MNVSDKLMACVAGGDALKELGLRDTGSTMENASQVFGTKPYYLKELFCAIADTIDAEEKELRDSAYRSGYDAATKDNGRGLVDADGVPIRLGDVLEFSDKNVSDMNDSELAEIGLMRLPKDADGVPILIGDVVTEHEDGHTFTVDGFGVWDGEWWVFHDMGTQAPVYKCHHKQITPEDVLREFALACDAGLIGPDIDCIVEKFAKRLQIKE